VCSRYPEPPVASGVRRGDADRPRIRPLADSREVRVLAVVTTYTVLKTFHVLAAVTWVGGNIVLQILGTRVSRERDASRLAATAGDFEFVGTRVFMPASLLVLGLGIWMVVITPAWDFSQLWIVAAIAMFAYSFASGAFYLGPRLARLKRIYAEKGTDAPEAVELTRRLFVFSRIELVLLILIVADMVLKPGA
jgi:uncharacterized membrane protein